MNAFSSVSKTDLVSQVAVPSSFFWLGCSFFCFIGCFNGYLIIGFLAR